ncbi:MAG: hypothetical protein J6L61_07560 [Ruminiclostridium sp.]|nr:hypothetical protein [Ruminiclostridium sp.]
MADYSIDDILAELDAKKSGSSSADNITADKDNGDIPPRHHDISATAIIEGLDGTDDGVYIREEDGNTEKVDAEYINKPEFTGTSDADADIDEITGEKSDVDKVLSETDNFMASDESSEIDIDERTANAKAAAEAEKPAPIKPSEPSQPVHEIKKDIVSDEEKRRMMLEKERENTNPDDMLALVNPLEVKEKVNEQVKEKELVSVAELSNMYAGNTQGIADDDLKAIAPQKTALAEKISETADMKIADESAPGNEENDEENGEEAVKEYHGKKTTDNLIEKLNKNLAQQRKENVRAHRTITLNTINGGKQTLQHPLNIDYQKQIIEATGAIPTENPVVEEEKQAELAAAKKHKLKDFVLEDDTPEQEEEPAQEEEFEDYDSTGQIWADLCASHKGLRIRLGLLTVITAISVIISALNDFNLFAKLGLGASFNFINGTTGDVNSLIYIYLVLGVLGFAICSTAISNGAIKLFTGKADCDSVCALTSALALIGGVIALVDVQTFKLGHSFIYLSTALVGLMFNTIGKIYMISRAKRNFKFVSGDSQKYYAEVIDGEERVSALTRAVGDRLPVIAAMRKTEFLTDFLKSSYCDDEADRMSVKLIVASVAAGLVAGVLAFLNPFGSEFSTSGAENPLYWAISAAVATISVVAPFSLLLVVNRPLARASKKLSECNAALLGYDAAVEFSDVNTVMVDAKALFPAGSVQVKKLKRWQKKNSVVKTSVDEAILMAASLAIHTDGILSYPFYDMTLGNKDLLKKVDNCIYEDNCGVTGWIGTKRVMLGGRALMETHSIDLPNKKNERKYCPEGLEPVYLAVSGEIVAMFVVGMTANPEIRATLSELQSRGITVLVHTTDSLVTVENLADLFELDASLIKVLPHEAHEEYSESTKYTSRGNGGLSCCGTFTSFARGVMAAKSLVRDFSVSKAVMLGTSALGLLLVLIMVLLRQMSLLTPSVITLYNTVAALVMMAVQNVRKY